LKGVKKCSNSGKIFVNSLLMDSGAKKLINTTSEFLSK